MPNDKAQVVNLVLPGFALLPAGHQRGKFTAQPAGKPIRNHFRFVSARHGQNGKHCVFQEATVQISAQTDSYLRSPASLPDAGTQSAQSAAAAPDANVQPNPSVHLQPQTGLVVVQLRDDNGQVMVSMPTLRAIAAYQTAGTPIPTGPGMADVNKKPDASANTNTAPAAPATDTKA